MKQPAYLKEKWSATSIEEVAASRATSCILALVSGQRVVFLLSPLKCLHVGVNIKPGVLSDLSYGTAIPVVFPVRSIKCQIVIGST